MSIEETLKAIEKWAKEFEDRINELEEGLKKRITKAESELYQMIRDLLDELDMDGSAVKNSVRNLRLVRKLTGLFDRFKVARMNVELTTFAEELLSVGALSGEYYQIIGLRRSDAVEKALGLIREIIGIEKDGAIIAGGYLDSLAESIEVQKQIRNVVMQGIIGQKGLRDLKRGIEQVVRGTGDSEGVLVRYWRQYAFDTFNQVHEVSNSSIADSLDLRYFIYQGSVIPTTRAFCEKRAGKVYSTDETKKWKDDPDLIDQKTKDSYNPLIERGRYNCRHFLNYISDDIAFELRPELKK